MHVAAARVIERDICQLDRTFAEVDEEALDAGVGEHEAHWKLERIGRLPARFRGLRDDRELGRAQAQDARAERDERPGRYAHIGVRDAHLDVFACVADIPCANAVGERACHAIDLQPLAGHRYGTGGEPCEAGFGIEQPGASSHRSAHRGEHDDRNGEQGNVAFTHDLANSQKV